MEYWNNTYVGSTKISAELARTVEEEATSNYKRKRPTEDALIAAERSKKVKSNPTTGEEDPKFQEFLRLNESRSKSKTFLNDDEEFVQQAAVEESRPVETVEDDEYENIPAARATEHFEVIEHETSNEQDGPKPMVQPVRLATVVPDDADDSEWLRNRTSRTLDLTDGIQDQMSPAYDANLEQHSTTTSDHGRPKVPEAHNSLDGRAQSVPVKAENLRPVTKTAEEVEADLRAHKEAARSAAIATIKETARLFLRNLAFGVSEEDLRSLFSNYGAVQEVHMPQSKEGTPKGTAYILFDAPDDAISAFSDLDGKSFHGRLLHILPAQSKIIVEKPLAPGAKVNVGEKRKEDRRKEASKSRFNWNSLFLNQNAVLENTAKKFGFNKSELLDPTQSNAAVTMALAESSALNTIKKFFISHGVNLESFNQTKQKDDSILLFKNLPSHANEEELRKLVEGAGGVIRRIVIPEIGGIAIVEVVDGNQGKMVFGKLAYRKFGDGLIYLEKGPLNTFSSAADMDNLKQGQLEVPGTSDSDDDADVDDTEKATIFVKNLNFDTRAPDLTKVFESLKGFRQATVKTKPNPKEPKSRLSMGFGFVEFSTEKDAKSALTTMQGFNLDSHALSLKLSNGKSTDTSEKSTSSTTSKPGTKIIVKNLPFETSKSDIQRLFSTYGTLKSLRLPKNYNSHLRGFAFLEFVSKRDAKNAMQGVRGTHLLGRRLVLEYATQEATGDEGIEQLVEKTRKKRGAVEAVESGKRKIGKVNLDGGLNDDGS